MDESTNTINQTSDLPEASAIRKNAAGISDATISIFLYICIAFFLPQSALNSIWQFIYVLMSLAVYRLISIVFFHQTIGMRLCNIQLLNEYDDRLSIKEKIFAAFFILINGIAYYKLEHK